MKKINVGLILGIAIGVIVLTIGIGGINKYLQLHKYEVVESSTPNESKEQLNSVVEVITKGAYENIQSLSNDKEKAYIVIADKNINNSDIDKIIKVGNDLDIKMSFLYNKIVNDNKGIQRYGNTVIPEGIDIERIVEEERINTVDLEKFYSFKSPDTKSVVIFIEDVKKLENSKEEFDKKIESLKSEGYTFKAFA